MKKFLKEYTIELAALFVGAFAIFLLVEQMDLRKNLHEILKIVAAIFSHIVKIFRNFTFNYLSNLGLSDVLGWILLFGILIFMVLRIRYRFSNSERWKTETCPVCGADIHRTHRTILDQILTAIFLPNARRYRCNSHKCGWCGLLSRLEHEFHPHQEQDIENITTQLK